MLAARSIERDGGEAHSKKMNYQQRRREVSNAGERAVKGGVIQIY